MAPGRLQPFQLLNADGEEVVSSDWSISDKAMADLKVEGGRAILTARVAGRFYLAVGHADPVEIEVLPDTYNLPHNVPRWILRPIDGQLVSALWAAPPNDDYAPAYFYLDRGESGAHVRAINEDGLQVWQWPAYHSTNSLRPICGDNLGGVIVLFGDGSSRVLISLDPSGHERWHVQASGFDGYAYTYANNGTFFFIEEEEGGDKVRLVGLDPETGDQTISLELRGSRQTFKNLAFRNRKLVCSPGTKTSSLPIRHSGLVSSSEAETHLVYSESSLTVDVKRCVPGTVVNPQEVSLSASQRLLALDVGPDLSYSVHIVEENIANGSVATTQITSSVPTGDIIPGEDAIGTFVAIRRTTQRWRAKASAPAEEFQYRITGEYQVKYRFHVPLSSNVHTVMLLGEHNFGFTARGRTVIAFDTSSAHERWRWEARNSDATPYMALADDSLVVRDGKHYKIIKDGRVQSQLDDNYMPFVERCFDPDPF
jgi:hypothetical protein